MGVSLIGAGVGIAVVIILLLIVASTITYHHQVGCGKVIRPKKPTTTVIDLQTEVPSVTSPEEHVMVRSGSTSTRSDWGLPTIGERGGLLANNREPDVIRSIGSRTVTSKLKSNKCPPLMPTQFDVSLELHNNFSEH